MEHIKTLFVRGQQIPNSQSAQWIPIGKLYKDGDKMFIAMDSVALSPSLLMQLEKVERTTAVSLFEPDTSAPRNSNQRRPQKDTKNGGHGFDDFKDDIPF